jgi:hypothetical protein
MTVRFSARIFRRNQKKKTEPRNYSRDAVRNRRQPEMHDADDAGR